MQGFAINVRFPSSNSGAANLDVVGADGNGLGSKPIRQVDGSALTDGHIADDATAELYYNDVGQGHWTLGAGARGIRGLAGPAGWRPSC